MAEIGDRVEIEMCERERERKKRRGRFVERGVERVLVNGSRGW